MHTLNASPYALVVFGASNLNRHTIDGSLPGPGAVRPASQ
jgi:hypothetical protein